MTAFLQSFSFLYARLILSLSASSSLLFRFYRYISLFYSFSSKAWASTGVMPCRVAESMLLEVTLRCDARLLVLLFTKFVSPSALELAEEVSVPLETRDFSGWLILSVDIL